MCPSREAQKSLGRCYDDPFVCVGNPICVVLDKKLGNRTKSKESVVKSQGSHLQPLAKHLSAFLSFFSSEQCQGGSAGGVRRDWAAAVPPPEEQPAGEQAQPL